MANKLRIGIHGACGRMGKMLVQGVYGDPDLTVAAALDAAGHPALGRDIGEVCNLGPIRVPVADAIHAPLDAVVDFSIPEASVLIAHQCRERKIPLLVATTGQTATQREEILACKADIPVLLASNTSLVVNVLMKLTRMAAEALRDKDFDVEIIERHHRFKADAPSGTALQFAEIIEEAMQLSERVYGRQGLTGQRPRSQIGLHAVRTGDNVGEHTIVFGTLGETMELVHKGYGRESYVRGALAGLKFLAGKPAGVYTMADVLGL